MTARRVLLTLSSLALVFMVLAVHMSGVSSAQPGFEAVRLSPDAPDVVAEQALRYTRAYMHILGEAPEVIRSTSVIGTELPALGLPEVSSGHPLMLVIIRGDIDVSGAWPGSSRGNTRYNYINYVFDLEKGVPVQIVAEREGNVLNRLLNPAERLDPPKPPIPVGTPLPDEMLAPTVVPKQ